MWRCHSVTSSLTKLLGALTWPRRRRPPCPRRPPLRSSHFVFRVHDTLGPASNDALSSGGPWRFAGSPNGALLAPNGALLVPNGALDGRVPSHANYDFVALNGEDAAMAAGKAGAAPLGSSLASLLASLTSFLRSISDSPAYGNLTTALLSGQLNADAPDDPHVRHFSVAARAPSAYVWRVRLAPALAVQARARRRREARTRRRSRASRTSGTRSGCPSSCSTALRSARARLLPLRATSVPPSTRSGGTTGS
jgi:hypothetical protein